MKRTDRVISVLFLLAINVHTYTLTPQNPSSFHHTVPGLQIERTKRACVTFLLRPAGVSTTGDVINRHLLYDSGADKETGAQRWKERGRETEMKMAPAPGLRDKKVAEWCVRRYNRGQNVLTGWADHQKGAGQGGDCGAMCTGGAKSNEPHRAVSLLIFPQKSRAVGARLDGKEAILQQRQLSHQDDYHHAAAVVSSQINSPPLPIILQIISVSLINSCLDVWVTEPKASDSRADWHPRIRAWEIDRAQERPRVDHLTPRD